MAEAADPMSKDRPYSWQADPIVGPLLLSGEARPRDRDGQTQATGTSGKYFAEPAQTLIFLDFDDTIFPTTELFERWGLPDDPQEWQDLQLAPDRERQLETWRGVVYQYLSTACALSDRVVIITNAKRPWVEECVAKFAPNIQPFFGRERLHVIYAKEGVRRVSNPVISVSEHKTREERQAELTSAKLTAMRAEAKRFYKKYPGQTWKNIMSVGDAPYEENALRDLAFQRNSSPQQPDREWLRHKVLRTPTAPPIADLTYRLRLATVLYTAYVRFDGEIDLDMNTPERLRAIADALDMPELKGSILMNPIQECEDDQVDEALDEVAIIVQHAMAD